LEHLGFVFHGYTVTHMDTFAHFTWKGKMYNGYPLSQVTPHRGALSNSVEAFKEGIITRGILLDIPKLKKIDWMKPGEGVLPEDLIAAEKLFNVKIRTGDCVVIRTGNTKHRAVLGPTHPLTEGTPAIHPACIPWFKDREIAIIGSDTSDDIFPAPYKNIEYPFHILALVSLGLPILDNLDLEQIAQECEKKGRYDFMISICPLRLTGVTGSPLNPIAMM